jgi:ribosomal protein S18 acetylase RimI-like enzyme
MTLNVQRVDYHNPRDAQALRELLNMYAQDPMGGGEPIAPEALARLCQDLAAKPFAFSFIAWQSSSREGEQGYGSVGAAADKPVGLINCFEAYSTFKALPLINIHDIAVAPTARSQGVGQALLQAVQQEAKNRGACKITLEVLSGNAVALKSYERFGFANYQLDPAAGQAMFMQKWL